MRSIIFVAISVLYSGLGTNFAIAAAMDGALGSSSVVPSTSCRANLPDNPNCNCVAVGHPPICQTIRQEDENGDWYYAYCKGDAGTMVCVGEGSSCECRILGGES